MRLVAVVDHEMECAGAIGDQNDKVQKVLGLQFPSA